MIDSITANPLFGICITLAAYALGVKIYSRIRISILHPVLTSSAIILVIIILTGIPLENYQNGGWIISFMLGPATVALAVPLYRQFQVLKAHVVVIMVSITVGAVVSIISTVAFAKLLGLPADLVLSLSPKSVTTPIAIEVSAKLGGLPSITALSVVFTGIIGAVTGPWLLKILRINHPTAKGLAMGTAAHAIGTSRALEMGENEGAVSSLSIGLAAIITALSAPYILSLLFNI
ncbi:MAG: LrgB family protein [Spirochaetales bacterium]|uniref:LrgB family protein n=1 Tax=Candidatus Thalassospirochaeta sargassi TaxID=3119039 RepID=A0AAJ1MJH7_9SPIO|nr:LrgB family protein [Spirochaetales bacterium]